MLTTRTRSLKRRFYGGPKPKPNLSLYSPYYAESCNELGVPISASRQHSYLRWCWSGSEPFATLCKILPAFGKRTLDLLHTRHAR